MVKYASKKDKIGGIEMMRKYKVKFTAKNFTGNAALVDFGRFADKLEFPKILKKNISIKRGLVADYSISDAVMML